VIDFNEGNMQHIVVLERVDEKPYQAEVLQEPPMLLTWRGMYFLFNRKTNQGSIAKNKVITYTYIEIYGCALRAITVETVGVSDD